MLPPDLQYFGYLRALREQRPKFVIPEGFLLSNQVVVMDVGGHKELPASSQELLRDNWYIMSGETLKPIDASYQFHHYVLLLIGSSRILTSIIKLNQDRKTMETGKSFFCMTKIKYILFL